MSTVVRRDTTHRYEKGGVYTYRRKTAGCMKDTGRRGSGRGKAGMCGPMATCTKGSIGRGIDRGRE